MSRPFPTLETSDPRFERDGLRHATVFSRALGRRADCTLWAPPDVADRGSLPLVILLHGVYGSHWAWTWSGGAHLAAAGLIAAARMPPCALAMPSDGLFLHGSGYLDHSGGGFERWIVDEVPALGAAVLQTEPDAPLALIGLSMGGFGALTLGARHGDRVRAAAGLSSITDFDQMALFVRDITMYDVDASQRSVIGTIVANRDRLPALHLDCGTDDLLWEPNVRLHTELDAHGVPHEWEVHDGGHSWDYWRTHVPAALAFCGRSLA